MASSEVDQKFLGHFAKTTSIENGYLSSFLFRVLGLSVILAEKLLKARRSKQLDPVRNPKDRHCIQHIIWLAQEGRVMVEQYVIPMVGNYVELKVLAYKLRASFYHIFVLFHNDPPINSRINRTRSGSGGLYSLYPDPLTPRTTSASSRESQPNRRQRSPTISLGGPVGGTTRNPPGLPIPGQFSGYDNSIFLWPPEDYRVRATNAFVAADSLAESLLPGSHPVRLSVKVEYVAYLYDCLNEREQSRRTARLAIRQVYDAKEGMDDESFEDAAEMVGMLGRMMKRGLSAEPGAQGVQQQPQQISAPPTVPVPPIPTSSPSRQGKKSSQTSSPGRSPARGRRRGNSVNTPGTTATTQPTTWV